MSWDIALNARHGLRGGIVTNDDEIMQRLWIRLNRELGDWFLNTEVGLPWYQDGYGILGSKPHRKNDIDLLLRRTIRETEGIKQVLKYNALFTDGSRIYKVYVVVELTSKATRELSFGVDMQYSAGGSPVAPIVEETALLSANRI